MRLKIKMGKREKMSGPKITAKGVRNLLLIMWLIILPTLLILTLFAYYKFNLSIDTVYKINMAHLFIMTVIPAALTIIVVLKEFKPDSDSTQPDNNNTI